MFNKKPADAQGRPSSTNTQTPNEYVSPAKSTTSTSPETAPLSAGASTDVSSQPTSAPNPGTASADVTTDAPITSANQQSASTDEPSLADNSKAPVADPEPAQSTDIGGDHSAASKDADKESGSDSSSPPQVGAPAPDVASGHAISPSNAPRQSNVTPVKENPMSPLPSDLTEQSPQDASKTRTDKDTENIPSSQFDEAGSAAAGSLPTTSHQPSPEAPADDLEHQTKDTHKVGTVGFAESTDVISPVQDAQEQSETEEALQDNQYHSRSTTGVTPDDPVLERGLQIPTRFSTVALGFRYPPILEQAGISKQEFRQFTKELKGLVGLSKTQWLACICCSCTLAIGGFLPFIIFGPLAYTPASIVGYKMAQRKRRRNMGAAQDSGNIEQVVYRWNKAFFQKRGLVCRVDLPRQADDMAGMDLATSALFKHQLKTGEVSSTPGTLVSGQNRDVHKEEKKLRRLQRREGRYRQKSSQRMRIVLAPVGSPHDMSHRYDGSLQGKRSAHSRRRHGSTAEPQGVD